MWKRTAISPILYLAAFIISSSDAEFCHFPKTNATLNCDEIFGIVHKCNADFVAAAMNHSDPFAICTNEYTFSAYRFTMHFYQELFTTVDIHNTSATCSEKFLNKNHMNVVVTFIGYSKILWTSANCDDCYVDISSAHQNFSDNTEKFLNSYQEYNSCVQNVTSHNTNSSLVCVQCDNNYQNLNNLYEHIKKTSGNKICFDLEDKMNKTRRDWSVTYRCRKGKRDSLTAFYSLASAIFVIAISFYGAVYFVGSKYSDLETLDERQILTNNVNEGGVQSSGPSSSKHRAVEKERKLIINQDDSSDDEMLTGSLPKDTNALRK